MLVEDGPAIAQAVPDPTIVVPGARQTAAEIRRDAREYVRKSGIAQGQVPAGRWRSPICAKVIGLQGRPAEIVLKKVEAVARDAGVRVAQPGCRGNLAIVFAADGAGVAQAIGRMDPRRMTEVPMPKLRTIYNGEAPVRWWYTTGESSSDGSVEGSTALPWTGGNSEGGGSALPGDSTMLSHTGSSLISTMVYRGIAQATVIVDVEAATGKQLTAVAAYVAMVALAEVQPRADVHPGSILSLFSPGGNQIDLSARDRELLRTLYRLPLDRTAMQHRMRLSKGIAEAKQRDE